MSLEPSTIESELRNLRPAALDASFLARLDACAGDRWTELDPAELAFEDRLRGFSPARLPAALTASLESALAGARFPNGENIVSFPKRGITGPRRNRGWWSAAAAVALTGAITAFLVPMNHREPPIADGSPKSNSTPSLTNGDKLIPAGFGSGLSEARDEGVIWQKNNRPHRVVKVVYVDRVTLKDANGATYQVEQPRVEYILVPAKTD